MSKASDFYQVLTARIVKAMKDDPGHWTKPWTAPGGSPRNVVTGRFYQGCNNLVLAFSGYDSPWWGTYKQWAAKGATVRKGEKGTLGLFWSIREVRNAKTGDVEKVPFARTFHVFNANQVDGWTAPDAAAQPNADERHEAAEKFFALVGATVNHGGDSAYYSPLSDHIQVPSYESFVDAASYYSTLAHEHGHWTGHKSRLNRDLKNRFGSEGYAVEELVAEITAAFTMAHLGLAHEPRPDHAQYLAHWLSVAGKDETAIYRAAQDAQKALNYMIKMTGEVETDEPAEEGE